MKLWTTEFKKHRFALSELCCEFRTKPIIFPSKIQIYMDTITFVVVVVISSKWTSLLNGRLLELYVLK